MDNSEMYGQQYEMPEDKSGILDTKTGDVLDASELTPLDVIRAVAKETGTILRDPNQSCKHCYGRGYTGRDAETKQPIPCTCIYPAKTEEDEISDSIASQSQMRNLQPKMNREQRRRMEKHQKKMIKKIMKMQKFAPKVDETEGVAE